MKTQPQHTKLTPLAITFLLLMATTTMAAPFVANDNAMQDVEIAAQAQSRHPDALIVKNGEVFIANTPLSAPYIEVHGTIMRTTPGDLVLIAERIHLANGGKLLGYDGLPGEGQYGTVAHADDGELGGSIVLLARDMVLATDSWVQSGSGGAGGSAFAVHTAEGGHGGNGGSIHLISERATLDGLILPGRGGDGGHALTNLAGAMPDAIGHTIAGNGGDSGFIYFNGEPKNIEIPNQAAPHSSSAAFCINNPGLIRTPIIPVNPEVAHNNKLLEAFDTPDSSNLKSPDNLGDDCGGGDYPSRPRDPSPRPNLLQYLESIPDRLPDLDSLPDLLPDLDPIHIPGIPGFGDFGTCTSPRGADGQDNYLGDGGQGGNGCSSAMGIHGAPGHDGEDRFFGCTAGGNGGHGTAASTSTAATGGNGGNGQRNGGNGGSATSQATGGSGGNGGNGGTASANSNCAGGHGGNGGSGTSGSATGGSGGTGLCGNGGAAGSASSNGSGGAGGAGGSGNPAGISGAPGTSSSGPATPGQGGQGPGAC